MLETVLPPLLLLMVAVGFVPLRTRPIRDRLTFGLTIVATIAPVLAHRDALPLPRSHLGYDIDDWWTRALAIVWWIVAARATVAIIVLVLGRDVRSRQARLFTDLVAGAVWLIASLVILNSVLRLPIGGVLATSGIVAVVIGLAMQSTLGDLFSGIAVGLDQPFHPGDRISIGNAMEGVVIQSNWRSIRIQTDSEDVVTIPNSIVARSHIVNRTIASERRPISVQIVITPDAPADRVIDLLKQAVMLCPDILETPAPSVMLSRLGIRSNAYLVNGFVTATSRMSAAHGQLLREARRVLHHAGIDDVVRAPEPQRLLRELPLFECLRDEQIEALVSELRAVALNPGEALYRQGEAQTTLFAIAAGVLEVSRQIEGQPRSVLRRISAGDYIGEIGLLTGDPRPATVMALTRVEAFELSREAIQRLIVDCPGLAPELERAVRRGMEIIHRDEAAHGGSDHDLTHALLARVREFFKQHLRFRDEQRSAGTNS